MGLKAVLTVLLAAVQLGGAFGEASATVESIDGTSMIVELEVELVVPVQAVVAHLAFEDDDVITLPLLDRGDGVFGIRTELAFKNYVVVFEALGVDEGTAPPVSLIDLGAELFPAGEASPDGEEGLSRETLRLGWLALALGAASLAVLAVWVLGEKRSSEEVELEEE
jgi:hypothetical protein